MRRNGEFMKTKSYVTTLLKFALAFTFAFILLILANVNVEAKTATVTNLKETDIEPYENPLPGMRFRQVTRPSIIVLKQARTKSPGRMKVPITNRLRKYMLRPANLFFMRVSAPTQLLTTMPIWTIKISVILETGLTP